VGNYDDGFRLIAGIPAVGELGSIWHVSFFIEAS
jgi:hypothetical protein